MVSADSLESLEILDNFIRSPAFTSPCDRFMNEHCMLFEAALEQEENKLEWTDIHKEYEDLVETLLATALTEVRMAELCGELPDFLKKNLPECDNYSEIILLLTTFSDFLSFKAMMSTRASEVRSGGKVVSSFEGLLNAGTLTEKMNTDGGVLNVGESNPKMQELLSDAQRMYAIGKLDGWDQRHKSETMTFSTRRHPDEKSGKQIYFGKTLFLVDLPARDQMKLWTTYGPERDKWDRVLCANSQIIKEFPGSREGNLDVIATATWVIIPKMMRWAMRLPDNAAMRVCTRVLDAKDGTEAYAMTLWDLKKDKPLPGGLWEETGIISPHPEDTNKSYIVAITKIPWYTPGKVLGKLAENMMTSSLRPLINSYKKYYNL